MVVLDEDGVLRSEIERAGGPVAYSKKARVDRATVHRTLKREERPGRKIISALDLRFVYAPKRDEPPEKGADIAIVRPADGQPLLLVNGKSVKAPKAQVALLACLSSELGRVVPYERLCRAIGHQSSRERQLRILRQDVSLVRRLLAPHKARCFLAVSAGVGYALCEVAQG
jgi:hypothetical protein